MTAGLWCRVISLHSADGVIGRGACQLWRVFLFSCSFSFQDDIIRPVRDALQHYTDMQNMDEGRKSRKEADNSHSKSSDAKNGGMRCDSASNVS